MWGETQDRAFITIKQKLVDRPVLMIFNPNHPTELYTNASATGVGAVFLVDSKMSVVAYFSKHMTADQRCYYSYELETMAVVMTLRYS